MKKLSPAAALLPVFALSLAGCIKFGSEPPTSLLTLETRAAPTVGESRSSANAPTVTVLTPRAPQELATVRVPVRSADTSIAYVKDAQWVDKPAAMFAGLLGDTIAATTGRVVLSERQALADPGALLTGELRSFGIDARTMEAVVVYDASLVRDKPGVFEKRRFEARVPVTTIDRAGVGPALSEAANQVARDVAEWIGG